MDTFTYAFPGATADLSLPPPPGYRVLRVSTPVGAGERVFATAGRALLEWRAHRAMGVRMDTDAPLAVPGARVVVGLGAGPLRVSGPCEVVWTVREDRRTGWAYGTLPGHPEHGEEAFVVERDERGTVWLRVYAFSRPAVWWTRAAGPLVPVFQRAYARRLGTVLRALAAGGDAAPGTVHDG